MSSPLDALIQSYGRLPIPSREEQVLLGRAIRAWLDWCPTPAELAQGITEPPRRLKRAGERARDQLVSRNMLLVAKEARSFSIGGPVLELQDLIQEGAIGLCRAAEKFDPALGYAFSTYAVLWIRQAMTRLVHAAGPIKIPQKRSQAMHRLRQWAEGFAIRKGRPPTDEEMLRAGIAGLRSHNDLVMLRAAAAVYRVCSLDAVGNDDDGDSWLNAVAAPASDPEPTSQKEWEAVIAVLEPWPLLQEAVSRRLEGQTYREIAQAVRATARTATRRVELGLLLARDLLRNDLPTSKSASQSPKTANGFWQPSLLPLDP